jgi:hypothetical protein
MSDFSELILVEPSIRKEFFFHKINMHKTNRYHISTIDQDNRDYSFDMEYNSNRWKIINAPKVPEWIMAIEKRLEEIIKARESTG